MYMYTVIRKNNDIQRKESGSALVVTMIVLAILTVLGLAALDVADVNILMSANNRDIKNAFFFADSGANVAHVFLDKIGVDVNATKSILTPVWRNETVSQFNVANTTISLYEDGTRGTYVRFGAIRAGRDPGYELNEYEYTVYLIRSHTNGQRNSRAEVDLGWKYFYDKTSN